MKQCVRLTVHPSNISVSQYNVLVRTVRPGPRDVGETSPHQKGPQPNVSSEDWAQPGQQCGLRAGPDVTEGVPVTGRGGSQRNADTGEEALCIVGRKTRKTDYNHDPKGDGEREGLGNKTFICKMGRVCVQRETGTMAPALVHWALGGWQTLV